MIWMVKIVKNGEYKRKYYRFVCKACGCIYIASEDEGTNRRNPLTGETLELEVECPMPFCRRPNISKEIVEAPILTE